MKLNEEISKIKSMMDINDPDDLINETKAFGELRKLNKNLYNETIKLENKIGNDVLKLIDDSIKKESLKYNNDKELELIHLIILDLLLDRFLKK
jgi:hypothetical protein